MATETSCHFGHLLQVSKKSLWSLILYNFFMISSMYIAPGQGMTIPWEWNFDANRNILSLQSFVTSFKNISLKSDFIHFFHDFIHVYSSGAEADSPQGTKFWYQQKCLVTSLICYKVQKKSLKSDFIQFFHDLIHVYSLQGTKFSCQQKGLIILPICCKF